MKAPYLIQRTLLGSILALTLMTGNADTPAMAAADDFSFSGAPTVNNKELDEMRGGFVTSNGMVIDFTFSTNTLVDNQLLNQVVINSDSFGSVGAGSLRNIIQIGNDNSVFEGSGIDINSLPNFLTIVQNNLDDLLIQQVNLFDITVENMDNFIQQSVRPEIDFQNTIRISP